MQPSSAQASELLIKAEEMTFLAAPFAWTLVRPPWPSDNSLKAKVFASMVTYVEEQSVQISVRSFYMSFMRSSGAGQQAPRWSDVLRCQSAAADAGAQSGRSAVLVL